MLKDLPLGIHELVHLSLSTLAACSAWILALRSQSRNLPIPQPPRLNLQKPRRLSLADSAGVSFGKLWLVALVSGFLIDIDHLVDHFFAFGIKGYFAHGIFSLFTVNPVLASGRVIMPLHAWEIFIAGAFFLFLGVKKHPKGGDFCTTPFGWIASCVFLSYGLHLLFDQLCWPTTPWGYFLTYRLFHGFSLSSF